MDIEGELLRPDIEAPKGDVQYRLGYYIVNAKGAWHWGQYCPFIPADDSSRMGRGAISAAQSLVAVCQLHGLKDEVRVLEG